MKIGIGYDVHKLAVGRDLVLGGVKLPFDKGLLGHSDADVLTHAIMDALLGAAGMGDIGGMFPESDGKYKDARSVELLSGLYQLLLERGYTIGNIDTVVIAEAPKIAPFVTEMRRCLAFALGIREEQINIKATTEEGLGFTGKGEGIAAKAVCLLNKRELRFV